MSICDNVERLTGCGSLTKDIRLGAGWGLISALPMRKLGQIPECLSVQMTGSILGLGAISVVIATRYGDTPSLANCCSDHSCGSGAQNRPKIAVGESTFATRGGGGGVSQKVACAPSPNPCPKHFPIQVPEAGVAFLHGRFTPQNDIHDSACLPKDHLRSDQHFPHVGPGSIRHMYVRVPALEGPQSTFGCVPSVWGIHVRD